MDKNITSIDQAVILAGGKGTRLQPLTNDNPKPMVKVAGKPFVEHLIELLKKNGITKVLFLLGYLPDVVVDYFGDGSSFGVEIEYSIGEVEEDTGTRVKNAEQLLSDTFLLLYADNYWPMQLERMLMSFNKHLPQAMVTVYNNRDGCGEYGSENTMLIDEGGWVRKYDYSRSNPDLNALDIGFFIMQKSAVEMMPQGDFSLQNDFFPTLIQQQELFAHQTDHPYYPITNPELLEEAEKFFTASPGVFVDRDGVINKKAPEDDYVKSWSEFEFLPGSIDGLRFLQDQGFELFVVSNQRGIARGMMSDSDVNDIHIKMKQKLEQNNVNIRDIYYCPHEKNVCWCRKPDPGMLFRAAREYHLDLTRAVMIGDRESDIQAGKEAGCRAIKVTTNGNLYEELKRKL